MKNHLTEEDKNSMLRCLGDCMYRFPAEFYLVRDNFLPRELAEIDTYNKYTRPTKWRLKTWKILLKTTFKDLAQFQATKEVSSCGVLIGLFRQIELVMDSFDDEDEAILEQANQLISERSIDEIQAEKDFKNLASTLDFEKFSNLVSKAKPEELGIFHKKFGEGIDLIGHVDKSGNVAFTTYSDATQVYFYLLMFGDFLVTLKNVEAVYLLYSSQFKENGCPHSEGSFKQICSRIGFTGASYRRRKK